MSGVLIAGEKPRTSGRAKRVESGPRRKITRAAFYIHLWLGVVATIALIAISITGILLNHKRGLGLMPDVPHEASAPFASSLSLEGLARAALEAAPQEAKNEWKAGDAVDIALIDRMDVRPRNGYVKVRLRDKASMEMTVDLASGKVVHVGRRGDVFLEKLHSGEAFGASMIILSDIAAIALVLTLLTGYWLWLVPKLGRSSQAAAIGEGE
jgi:uncharacterized iron-regulated membrane protein